MIIGVPKEIKDHETRVGLVPSGVTALREAGHEVLVETHAGEGSSLTDQEYAEAGASILDSAAEVWQRADLVVKVKEPQTAEYGFFRPDLILFTYLHLAPLPELTDKLVAAKVNGVAYETIRERDGSLPLLTPMSEVAGRMSVQVGAQYLERPSGRSRHSAGRRARRGARQRGDPGRRHRGHQRGEDRDRHGRARRHHRPEPQPPARTRRHLQRTGGHAGFQRVDHQRESEDRRPGGGRRADSGRFGASPGAARDDFQNEARRGGGGCRHRSGRLLRNLARHHAHEPIYFVDGVLHYCVSNMPAAVPHTSTLGLTNATFPYLLELANHGLEGACQRHAALREGVNTYKGYVTYKGVGESQGREWRAMASVA